jgi:antitoxin component of RelBE/YafQ-DinJ toxin-antitoxin module
MKTTVEIADPLLREAKRVAKRAGITLRELIELGLRRVLDERRAVKRPFKLRDARNRHAMLKAGIRPGDWEQIRDLAYGLHVPERTK